MTFEDKIKQRAAETRDATNAFKDSFLEEGVTPIEKVGDNSKSVSDIAAVKVEFAVKVLSEAFADTFSSDPEIALLQDRATVAAFCETHLHTKLDGNNFFKEYNETVLVSVSPSTLLEADYSEFREITETAVYKNFGDALHTEISENIDSPAVSAKFKRMTEKHIAENPVGNELNEELTLAMLRCAQGTVLFDGILESYSDMFLSEQVYDTFKEDFYKEFSLV